MILCRFFKRFWQISKEIVEVYFSIINKKIANTGMYDRHGWLVFNI